MAFADKRCFALQPKLTFRLEVWLKARKGITRFSPPHRVLRQGSAQVRQSFSEPVVLQIRPHYADADNRPVYGPSAFDLPKVIWREIVEAPADDSLVEEVQTNGKGSRGRCTRWTLPRCLLNTTAFEARYPPGHLPWPVPPINFASGRGRVRPTPRGCG